MARKKTDKQRKGSSRWYEKRCVRSTQKTGEKKKSAFSEGGTEKGD